MADNITIINPDSNDFFMVQNFVLQLVAENQLTPTAFTLYCFYRSLSGYAEIKTSYQFLELNTGLSSGCITKCNRMLVKNKLIRLSNNGFKKPYTIHVTPGAMLPRRKLKQTDKSMMENVQNVETYPEQEIKEYFEQTSNKPTIRYNKDEEMFLDAFIAEWKKNNNVNAYPKHDLKEIKKIKNIKEAQKYIPTLWTIGEVDDWIHNSDHTLTIFVKEFNSGKLQSFYAKNMHSY